jgi:hypothetical protein
MIIPAASVVKKWFDCRYDRKNWVEVDTLRAYYRVAYDLTASVSGDRTMSLKILPLPTDF